ncbi:GNAT family N-acetyltransferase, partial [Actinomyces oris]
GARTGEVGYWLAAAARGRGTMTRAVAALIDMAFDPSGPLALSALRWRCDIHETSHGPVPNWASWKVAWSLGFQREGRVRRFLPNDGRLHDGWIATLLPEDPREPRAPWDGPVETDGVMPLVAHDGVGEREGDDPEALVRRFHHVYGLPVQTDGASLERESLDMRMSLIAEEFSELVGAVYGQAARAEIESSYRRAVAADDGTRDTVETADALADLIYVIYGMALETGIDLASVLAEVQRSNMSKLGADGKPVYREDGKVLKGPGYFPPNVEAVLRSRRLR